MKFFTPDPKAHVARQLLEAKMSLLQAKAAKESWDAQVAMLEARVKRLEGAL